jgi:hypothetical protein
MRVHARLRGRKVTGTRVRADVGRPRGCVGAGAGPRGPASVG